MSRLLIPLLAEAALMDGGRLTLKDGERLSSCTLLVPVDFVEEMSLKSCAGGRCEADLLDSFARPASALFAPWRMGQPRCEACEDCDVVEPWEALRLSFVRRGSFARE